MSGGSHYSLAFDPRLDTFCEFAKEMIEEQFGGKSVILYFTGFSGIAHGLTLYHKLKNSTSVTVNAAYIRKKGEVCHGQKVEVSPYDQQFDVCIFVDDFIESGDTLRYATETLLGNLKCWMFDGDSTKFFHIIGDFNYTDLDVHLSEFNRHTFLTDVVATKTSRN